MKKIIIILFIFMFPIVVKANSINSIDMDIFIDNNGNARITEVWDAYLESGTEGFHSYGNIGESYISDLSVSMNGKNFEIVDTWNVEYNMTAKENKAYIGSALDGEYGVYFGISRYGHNKYIISYTINNFIVKLKDANMLYWNLVPQDMGSAIGSVDITIYGDKEYSNSLDVWGYGKYGALAYVDKGKIHMKADNVLQSEYLTLLVKYPSDMFNPSIRLNKNFNYYKKMAGKGKVSYNDNKSKIKLVLNNIFSIVFSLPFLFIIIISLFLGLFFKQKKDERRKLGSKKSYQNNRCDFGDTGTVVDEDMLPYRDIPTDDIFRAFWIIHNYNLGVKDENILSALLLKWISEGYIRLEKEYVDGDKKEVTNIIFLKKPTDVNEIEMRVFDYFYSASMGDVEHLKVDNKLSKEEFSKWCHDNINKIIHWIADALDSEVNVLVKEKKVTVEKIEHDRIYVLKYNKNSRSNKSYDLKYNVDSSMMKEAEQMVGFKKFLEEFTIVKDREPLEVKVLDKYLVYASLFGITDRVYENLKGLYPELMESVNIDLVDIECIVEIAAACIVYAKSLGITLGSVLALASPVTILGAVVGGGGGGFR